MEASTKGAGKRVAEEFDLTSRLRMQFEFYFSDANLRHDEHMRKLLGGTEAQLMGWTNLDHVASFQRAKALLQEAVGLQTPAEKKDETKDSAAPEETKDSDVAKASEAALRQELLQTALADSDHVEISEDGTQVIALSCASYGFQVRRKRAFEEVDDLSIASRTVYVEPIAEDETHASITQAFATCGPVYSLAS